MRFAYADPPYLRCAAKLYGDATYDSINAHGILIRSLDAYDGWAYSLSSSSLKQILPLCPDDVRIAAWVKPFCSFKPGVNPAYAWEPVIYRGARKRSRQVPTVRDFVSANITLKKGLAGAKPTAFSIWLFDLLGILPTDEFTDIFPGSGMVSDAWTSFQRGERMAA
jgi:hypothetical protein